MDSRYIYVFRNRGPGKYKWTVFWIVERATGEIVGLHIQPE